MPGTRALSRTSAPASSSCSRRSPGERVLDLGCGDGALTEKLVAAGCRVIAIDSSAEQIGAARARGLDARRGRAETLPFKARVRRRVQQRRAALDSATRPP